MVILSPQQCISVARTRTWNCDNSDTLCIYRYMYFGTVFLSFFFHLFSAHCCESRYTAYQW